MLQSYLPGNPKEEHPGSGGCKQEEGNNRNMFGGFDPRFLAEASNVKVGITKKLQSHAGDQIIKKKNPRPEKKEEVVEEKEIRKRKHLKGEHEGCGECEEKTRTHYYLRREWHEHKGQQDGKEESRERYKERGEGSNVLEESLCTLKLHENIADPSHADIFNPRAGRLRANNSLTLPVLKLLRLSAQLVKLYKSDIYVPHWSMNANSVASVTHMTNR
ncbi:Legumin K [Glycine soja]|uniref:Legumin K n=1 Tax=Glycine soja TaxID=3848 RepID=A0A445LCB0_GLYSO|nr:Legumin K [Glycine soja]